MVDNELPYCGAPPAPADLAVAWNFDWRLLLALGVVALYWPYAQRRASFVWGWLALLVAFVSPLCALTTALFAARSAHHMWVLTVAAPLLGLALPAMGRLVGAAWSLLAMLAVLALWHVPLVYGWAWQSHAVYALLQIGLLLPAVVFWARTLAMLQSAPTAPLAAVLPALAYTAVLAGVMGLLGAVLTFAPHVLYPQHGMAPLLYGLEPLQDQQLAGLLMWVPGLLPLAWMAGWLLHAAWRRATAAPVQTQSVQVRAP